MSPLILIWGAGALLAAFILITQWRRKNRRQRTTQMPFPDEWAEILANNLPPYAKLTDDLKEQLQRRIKIFLADKSFEGCEGVTITDEMRVTIAAQACMLLLNRPGDDVYPKLRSILVYPSAYVAGRTADSKDKSVRLGESWGHGTVVLAWDAAKHGARNFKDSRNVTLHEFAHQLDQADGAADGAPILEERSAYGP